MNSSLASLICACGIAGLLYLDRDRSVRVSMALWIPGIWIGTVGSRPASQWLGLNRPELSEVSRIEGSPFDAAFFGVLLCAAIVVLISRKSRTRNFLRANQALLLYFAYCLVSIVWAYYPAIAFKHWIKAIGDLAMALVIATDAHPVTALRRLVSRIGMLLFPVSVLLIRYYDELGRGYTSDGLRMNTGVTTNKNSLGLIVLVVSLVVFWNVRSLFLDKTEPNRSRRLFAQGILLAFGLTLFRMADCSTCKACFVIGSLLILALNTRAIRVRPARAHILCLAILVAAITSLLFGQTAVASALGRDSSLSGRTDIWKAVIPAVPNPFIGAGFESFWISPNVQIFQRQLLAWGWYPPLVQDLNEAHNGYIEMYLNLGWIGVCLITLVMLSGYRRAFRSFRRDPEFGSLLIAYIVIGAIYSVTEAGFRFMCPSWIFLVAAIVCASGVSAGPFRREIPASESAEFLPERARVHSAWQRANYLQKFSDSVVSLDALPITATSSRFRDTVPNALNSQARQPRSQSAFRY